MKKVININFQGRVLPIEENAYEMLTKYVDSLRRFFANEEGRDEIINDIEGRIAELFSETLKKGSTCITEADVNTIINSMGRPEDFDDDETKVHSQLGGENTYEQSGSYQQQRPYEHKRLYRDENHKIIAGVCSGLANYFGIDPVIVRILVLVTLGVTLLPYLILWVAVPSSASTVIGSQRKRLFRDPDNKFIAGVCSGLSQYFGLNIWIPRVLFLLPFLSFIFRNHHWGFWDFPDFLSFSFSPTSIIVYVILWLVLPEAKSAADKLEMKGEKVDLNNIKTTIQGDLGGFKDKAQQFGAELKEKAQEFSETLNEKSMQFTREAEPVIRKSRRGLGDFIALIAKIFAYLIVGCILFSLIVSLFGMGVAFTGLLPAKDFVLRDGLQSLYAWGSLILFVWVPVVGILTFIIRRLAKKRGNSSLIRYTFLSLWLVGVFCFVSLIVSLVRDFKYKNNPVEETLQLTNPTVNKLEVKIQPFGKYYNQPWLTLEPFGTVDADTVFVKNIRLRLVKADSDKFVVTMVKLTNGRSRQEAESFASKINFTARQNDTTLFLDKGIALTRNEKFRNQQVILTIAVPVGKRIKINDNVVRGGEMNIHIGNDDYWSWENDMDGESYRWQHDVEYVMTEKGLERVYKDTNHEEENHEEENNEGDDESNNAIEQFRKSKEQMEREKEQKLRELQEIDRELQRSTDSTRYQYKGPVLPKAPAREERRTKATAKVDVAPAVHNGISDMLMIKFAL